MLILAIDTALDACSAAILDTERSETLARETHDMSRGHAEALMPLIARVLAKAALAATQIDRFAVTCGPGSFTGLRVGISAARGMALATGKPALGVTTLAAFAAPHVARAEPHPVIAAIDARHGQLYFQAVTGNGRILIPPRVGPVEEVLRASRFGAPCLTGNAAAMLADLWPSDISGPPARVDQNGAPDIAWVGWLGAAIANTSKSPAKPLYLRPPDAQPPRRGVIARRAAGPAPDAS